jgi:hypothetical protein
MELHRRGNHEGTKKLYTCSLQQFDEFKPNFFIDQGIETLIKGECMAVCFTFGVVVIFACLNMFKWL